MPRWTCRACKEGNCPECSNWLDRSGLCSHLCADESRQLTLPWVMSDGVLAESAGLDHQPTGQCVDEHQDQEM
jgi:hypothetical protein